MKILCSLDVIEIGIIESIVRKCSVRSVQPVKATATEIPPTVPRSRTSGKTRIGINGMLSYVYCCCVLFCPVLTKSRSVPAQMEGSSDEETNRRRPDKIDRLEAQLKVLIDTVASLMADRIAQNPVGLSAS
nr:glyceraldehyde-3-phosphate dehydrogenase gapcp2, chloroplastic [Quercus suber]